MFSTIHQTFKNSSKMMSKNTEKSCQKLNKIIQSLRETSIIERQLSWKYLFIEDRWSFEQELY